MNEVARPAHPRASRGEPGADPSPSAAVPIARPANGPPPAVAVSDAASLLGLGDAIGLYGLSVELCSGGLPGGAILAPASVIAPRDPPRCAESLLVDSLWVEIS
jgi:hypothetical protein